MGHVPTLERVFQTMHGLPSDKAEKDHEHSTARAMDQDVSRRPNPPEHQGTSHACPCRIYDGACH